MTKARDIADFKFEDIVDTGTEGTKVASGTTAERGSTAGQLRFNTTTGLAEYYTGTEFKAIDTPPLITSVDVTNVETDLGGTQTFVITGSLFNGSATLKFRDNGGTLITPDTTTVNSSSQITVTKTRSSFSNANEPYDLIVTNPSGLEATLDDAINVDNSPVWQTASGSLGTVFDSTRGSASFTVSATDSDGDTIAYSLQSGSLPAGASLNSSTGVITGFSAVGSDTTSNFTLRATTNSKTADRAFSIVVSSPVTQTFNYTGASQTFTVPSNITSFIAYMWGAGGSGGSTQNATLGGNGGAGAYVTANISNYSAGQTFGILVGQSNVSSNNTAINAFGGGGNGGGQLTQRVGGSGGGRSEINIGTVGNTPNGTRILVAGGGGGGNARYQTNESAQTGGIGGYTSGGNGSGDGTVPTGGSQSAGGNAGSGLKDSGANPATAGTAGIGGMATGGDTAVDTNYGAGAGGGGGYFGGGGGDGGRVDTTTQSGAGGSSYANPTYASSITHTNGSGQTAPETGNTYYTGNIASGGNGKAGTGVTGTAGGHGKVVIVY